MKILTHHLSKYPEMQLSDSVKLLFQRVFGAGHMIKNESESLLRLEKEFDEVDFTPGLSPVEDIGGEFARVHLSAVKGRLSAKTLNRIFVLSANGEKNAVEEFEKLLEPLKTSEENIAFLEKYKSMGYPAMSHSEIYREKYAPHYRIVRKKYAELIDLFIETEEILNKKGSVFIAVDGPAASGKTTLAETFAEVYDCNVFHADDYFLPPERKTPERLAEIGGNIDYERLKAEIIDNLHTDKPFVIRKFDCSTMTLGEKIEVERKPITLVEGVYSLHPTFGDVYDVKRILKISKDEQLRRLEKRNPRLLERFKNEWLPMEERYFETL